MWTTNTKRLPYIIKYEIPGDIEILEARISSKKSDCKHPLKHLLKILQGTRNIPWRLEENSRLHNFSFYNQLLSQVIVMVRQICNLSELSVVA